MGRLLGGLIAYHDTRNSGRESSEETNNSSLCDFYSRNLRAGGTRGDHIWLEEYAFEENIVVMEGLDNSGIDL